jgi:3-deoxy-D-manno-octulosonate 8-phosphate phosphatase KdsC-like HAD superfamily phosphatase
VWDKKPVGSAPDRLNLTADQVAVMGDDIVDVPLMRGQGEDLRFLKLRKKFGVKQIT